MKNHRVLTSLEEILGTLVQEDLRLTDQTTETHRATEVECKLEPQMPTTWPETPTGSMSPKWSEVQKSTWKSLMTTSTWTKAEWKPPMPSKPTSQTWRTSRTLWTRPQPTTWSKCTGKTTEWTLKTSSSLISWNWDRWRLKHRSSRQTRSLCSMTL